MIPSQDYWLVLYMCVRYTPGIHYLLCLRCVKYSSSTVDREIFTLKIIHVKIFMVVNFCSLFDLRNFLTVVGYNADECLESYLCLVYYQVLEKPGIAGCI